MQMAPFSSARSQMLFLQVTHPRLGQGTSVWATLPRTGFSHLPVQAGFPALRIDTVLPRWICHLDFSLFLCCRQGDGAPGPYP